MTLKELFNEFADKPTRKVLDANLVEAVISQHRAELSQRITDLKGKESKDPYAEGRLAGLLEARNAYSFLYAIILEKHLLNEFKSK